MAIDQGQEPDLRWHRERNLPPLPSAAEAPSQEEQQHAPRDAQQPNPRPMAEGLTLSGVHGSFASFEDGLDVLHPLSGLE